MTVSTTYAPITLSCFLFGKSSISSTELLDLPDLSAHLEESHGGQVVGLIVNKWDEDFGWSRIASRNFTNDREQAEYWLARINDDGKPVGFYREIVARGIEHQAGLSVTLNAPEFFARNDFIQYLESNRTFTWHQAGEEAGEYSDVIVLLQPSLNGDGTDSQMPEDIWRSILAVLRRTYGNEGEKLDDLYSDAPIVVRLTNMDL